MPDVIKKTPRRSRWLKGLIKDRYLYVLLLPGLAYFFIFRYLPMGGLFIAFKDYNIFKDIWGSPWVGFDNFRNVFSTPDFWKIFRNTILISFYKIAFGFPAPIILALLLNEIRHVVFQRTIQTIIYIPHFISWVVISGIMLAILSPAYGVAGALFDLFGLEPVNLMAHVQYFRSILVASNIWKEVGWGTIIYLAAISTVDSSLYEAANMDGAGRWRKMWHITIPSISTVIILLLILQIGNIMDAGFEQILVLQNDLVRGVSEIIDTYVYRIGLTRGDFSFAAAVGFFNSVIAAVLILAADRVAKLLGREGLF